MADMQERAKFMHHYTQGVLYTTNEQTRLISKVRQSRLVSAPASRLDALLQVLNGELCPTVSRSSRADDVQLGALYVSAISAANSAE